MADLSKPMRAVRLTLKLDADDMRELCYALRTLADHAERNELTTGVMGGSDSGYIYELLVDPTITHDSYHAALREYLDGLKVQQAEPVLQTCNCRWNGDVQTQQCTLHESHVAAIHEWAERAKAAEKKLAALAQADSAQCDHCSSPLFAAVQCRVCGR